MTSGMPRAAATGAAASSAVSRTTTSGRRRSMIGVRSRRIAGPATRAKFAANSGPRRCAIGSCMIPPRPAAVASRRADVVSPAADQSNPIAPTASPPSAAIAQCTSWPRSRRPRATGASAWTCPAPPVLVHSTRSERRIRASVHPQPSSRTIAPPQDREARTQPVMVRQRASLVVAVHRRAPRRGDRAVAARRWTVEAVARPAAWRRPTSRAIDRSPRRPRPE